MAVDLTIRCKYCGCVLSYVGQCRNTGISMESQFYLENREMAEYECEYLTGSGQIIIENLLYLKGFSATNG